jgi:hypothetical protein
MCPSHGQKRSNSDQQASDGDELHGFRDYKPLACSSCGHNPGLLFKGSRTIVNMFPTVIYNFASMATQYV